MTVNIDVELNDLDGLAKVKGQIESLDEDLDLDFDLEKILDGEFGDIEIDIDKKHLKSQISDVFDNVDGANFNLRSGSSDGSGSNLRAGRRRALGEREISLDISDLSNKILKTRQEIERIKVRRMLGQGSGQSDQGIDVDVLRNNIRNASANASQLKSVTQAELDVDRSSMKKLKRNMTSLSLATSNITNALENLRPSFRQVRAVIYTLLPALIGLGAQLISVAVGITALTAATGAVAALGLLGGASESLEGSMASAEERVNSLKRELFQVIEPVADLFSPITDDLFGEVVANVRGLTDEMAALRPLTDVLFDGVGGFGTIIEETLQSIIRLGPELQQLAGTFGSILTAGIPELFSDLFVEGIRTSDMLIKVSKIAFELGRIIYFVSKAVVSLLAVFAVFTPVLKLIADLLGSRIGQSLMLIIGLLTSLIVVGVIFAKLASFLGTVITILNTAMMTQIGILGVLKSTWTGQWIISAIGAIQSLTAWVMGLNSALATTAALVSIATLGLAALAGAGALAVSGYGAIKDTMTPEMPRRGRGGGSTYNDVTMNFQGKMDNKSRQKMEDVARGVMYQDDLSNGNFGTSQ